MHTDDSTLPTTMKFASSATLLLAAALSTLCAAQTTVISQASIKPMIVKPGGLVTVTQQFVFSKDFRRILSSDGSSSFTIEVSNAARVHLLHQILIPSSLSPLSAGLVMTIPS